MKNCVIPYEKHVYGRLNLQTLVRESSLIFIGALEKQYSELDEQSNIITTLYTVRVEKLLKGSATGNIVFRTLGGRHEFVNGTTAELATTEWKQLKIGQKYALFLKLNPINEYIPTNGIEALFRLSTKDGAMDALVAHERGTGPHPIIEEVKGLAPSALTAKVQTILSRGGSASQR